MGVLFDKLEYSASTPRSILGGRFFLVGLGQDGCGAPFGEALCHQRSNRTLKLAMRQGTSPTINRWVAITPINCSAGILRVHLGLSPSNKKIDSSTQFVQKRGVHQPYFFLWLQSRIFYLRILSVQVLTSRVDGPEQIRKLVVYR